MTLLGIDISLYQKDTPPLTGLSFVLVRAGYGSGNPADPKYAMHAANVRAAGLALGSYWFWYDGQDNAAAVAQFLQVAGSADLLALDFEGVNHGTASALSQARDFIARVQATGRKIGLYASASGYPDVGQDWNWIAQWSSTPPTHPYTFWQYVGTNLDKDQFNGDASALAALIASQEGASDVGFNFGTGTATVGPAGGRICTSPLLSTALASPRLTAGAKFAILGGISGWRVGLVTLSGEVVARWVPASDIVAQVNHADIDSSIIAGVLPVAGFTQAQLDAAKLAAIEAQYDLDAKSITAKLSNVRP